MSVKLSATMALSEEVARLKASGIDVIHLGVGEPDWSLPEEARQAALRSIEQGKDTYTPSAGLLELRQHLSSCAKESGWSFQPDEVFITAGGKLGLFLTLQSVVRAGDRVLVPSPYWPSYPNMIEMVGGVPEFLSGEESLGGKWSAKQLRGAFVKGLRAVIINSPNNPVGYVYSREEFKELAQVFREFPEVFIVCDDVYSHLVFNQQERAPHILDVAMDLKERVFVINSASKNLAMTGWRVGWVYSTKERVQEWTSWQSQTMTCPNSIAQYMLLSALPVNQKYILKVRQQLSERIQMAQGYLENISGLTLVLPEGATYLWLDLREWLKMHPEISAEQMTSIILKSTHVALNSGADFGDPGFLRMSLTVSQEVFERALSLLKGFFNQAKISHAA